MKPKINVRAKGASFERFIAIELRKIDHTARRNMAESQIASVDILTRLPLAIQCKALKNWGITPHNIYEQACEGSLHNGDVPVGIVKINKRQPVLCFLALEHFLSLMEALYGVQDTNSNCFVQLKSWLSDAEAPSTVKTLKPRKVRDKVC